MSAPEDPMNAMAVGAVGLHTLFMAYVDAGFTRDEALRLIMSMLSDTQRKGETPS